MKKYGKALLALGCILALMAGTAVSAGVITKRMLEVEYMGVQLEINGRVITPIGGGGDPVEPFVVDGTTYVPVRVLGDVLGKRVAWDQTTRTVRIGEAPFVEDAKQLVDYIEGAHPAFSLGQVPPGYVAAKNALLSVAENPESVLYDFAWAALAYTAVLEDGHTSVDVFGGAAQSGLDIGWTAVDDALFLTDTNGAPTKTHVTEIGGVAVEQIFSAIDNYFVAENATAQSVNRALWAGNANLLAKVAATSNADGTVTVKLSDVPERQVAYALPQQVSNEKIITAQMLDDVYYIDLNACVVGPETTAVAGDLKSSVEKGTKKVIIDVRGNGGGTSAACLELLTALGMEAPSYGAYTRYSQLALDEAQSAYLPSGIRRGYQQAEGAQQNEKPSPTAKANPAVQLVVLTDEGTFSSATMLAVWVQDGQLGTVVGRPSANSPNHYGDILYYRLANTGLYGTTSHVQWQRPDQGANLDTLTPDITTKVGQDALQAALDFLG